MESPQLLQEADRWLAELESKFPKRNFTATVVNLEGISIFVTRYIKALQPPADIPDDDVSTSWRVKCAPVMLSNLQLIVASAGVM